MTSLKIQRKTALPTPVIWGKTSQKQINIVDFLAFLHSWDPKIQVYEKKFWNIFFFWLENSDFLAKVENMKNPDFGHVSRLIMKTNEFFKKNCLLYMKGEPFGSIIQKKLKLYHFFPKRYLRSLTPTISPIFQSGSTENYWNRVKIQSGSQFGGNHFAQLGPINRSTLTELELILGLSTFTQIEAPISRCFK